MKSNLIFITKKDNYVKDADIIWDEPESDKGRVLYTDSKNIRCATLNKLLLNLTSKLGQTIFFN